MRLAPVLAAWAALAASLAGCSGPVDGGGGDGGRGGGDGGPDAARGPPPTVETYGFTLGAGAGLPVGGPVLPTDDGRRTPFEVPAGHAHLAATAEWECDVDLLCELELELRRGEQEILTSGFGPSPVAMEVDDPPPGQWTFWAFPSGDGSLPVGVEGTLTVALT